MLNIVSCCFHDSTSFRNHNSARAYERFYFIIFHKLLTHIGRLKQYLYLLAKQKIYLGRRLIIKNRVKNIYL